MQAISFLKNYIKYPKMIGAVCPSSKYLAKKMVANVDFKNAKCIVEYGPGTGVFTNELIKRKKEDTVLLVLELNEELFNSLQKKYEKTKNVYIINDSAEKVGEYVEQHGFKNADYIVSGLPFAAFPEQLTKNILDNTLKTLNKDGKFITFQYTLLKRKLINQFFSDIKITFEIKNIPPAFVFSCAKSELDLKNYKEAI
ncbi:class I SAM-dependent methyltransferase [Clostridium ganghwense]|uniref:Methyltransferase n=1 Tax=Clostridium ganghwense TaxID=312089 RepID=A0ABT4CPR3_9CLOT|nr:rRNA adenine N-6-methyltransferase family protein [Clostridium ganghwense]MCY6371047.1 methyltransferase [Clostridium ganghwense]